MNDAPTPQPENKLAKLRELMAAQQAVVKAVLDERYEDVDEEKPEERFARMLNDSRCWEVCR